MESSNDLFLRKLVEELCELDNATQRVLAMKYTASPDPNHEKLYAEYCVLYAIAREIGTNDPLSDANLRGICANARKLRAVLEALVAGSKGSVF